MLLFVPLLTGGFNLIMHVTGYAYLTLENLGHFLLHPFTIIALACLLILAAAYAMLDISAVVFTMDQSVQKNPVTLGQILRFSYKNSVRVCQRKNILLVPVVLLLLPLLNIGLASGFLTTVSIPEFILDYIKANRLLSVLFTALILALMALTVRWLYAFHYFTLEECTFHEARKKSIALGKGKRLHVFLTLLLTQAGFFLLYGLEILLVIAVASLLGKLFSGIFLLKWLSSTIVWLAIALSLAVMAALAVPVGYGCVSILYYHRKAEMIEPVRHIAAPDLRKTGRLGKCAQALKIVLICFVAVGSLVLGYVLSTGRFDPQIEYLRTMEVTAHRGASAFFPENTMSAFVGARNLGADWIELDVQQTKDGKIIVLHDTNLHRTTGVFSFTWDMTYDEIAQLDAGSFFSSEFKGEKIPLLSEVLDFAKMNGVKLNIEMKPTGHETDFEKNVVDLVQEAGMEDQSVITSQVYEALENVKAYAPDMTTVYVMSLAYGDVNKLTAADGFSVEATSATKSMVSRVHNAGKQIYAWTVNTKESINKMIDMNVDNIITDNIELARQCINESRYSSLLGEYMKLLH